MRQNRIFSGLLVVLLFICTVANGEEVFRNPLDDIKPLSKQAEFSLLTCDPGNQLYSTFGHSALCLHDPVKGVDIVFNYGTFNFNTPNFYGKFASGRLLYTLSIEHKGRFISKYISEDITVVEQKLNLTYWQKQELFNAIAKNYEPENRYYKYDFIYDNCATRIRDIFEDTFGDSLVYVPEPEVEEITFRTMLHNHLENSKWSDLGIKLVLGNVVDVNASQREKAFLPYYLMDYCTRYEINGKPFVTEQYYVVEGGSTVPVTPFFASPQFFIWLLFACFVFFQILKRKADWIIADKTIFFVVGIVGLLVFLQTFFTDHFATQSNMNILWANPLYILLAILLSAKLSRLKLILAIILLIGNLVAIVGWGTIQVYHTMMLPIIAISSTRLVFYILRYRRSS